MQLTFKLCHRLVDSSTITPSHFALQPMASFDRLRWLYTAPCEVFFAFNLVDGGEDIARKEVQFFLIEVSDPRLCKHRPLRHTHV